MQAYSDPKRAQDPHALPDLEIFQVGAADEELCPLCTGSLDAPEDMSKATLHETEHLGFYYWFCFPGCMPDSEAEGPFETEADALRAARALDDDTNEIEKELA